MNVSTWIAQASARLAAAGIDSAPLESQVLAGHVLLKDRSWIIAHPEEEINELAAEALLQRREGREPLAYILGWREFYGRRFRVRPGVLIPRQETETLVETALAHVENGPILDLGTGSGCVAITLKLERPDLEVWASDVSDAALEVAHNNADALGANVNFVSSNLFSALSGRRYTAVVSNPPYIADSEELAPEVGVHEPKSALFAGPTGMEFYERLALEAPGYLETNGMLIVEVGHTQSLAVAKLLGDAGWRAIQVVKDLSGVGRVVLANSPST
jgi:release factor glutamine methyltransferase